MKNKKMKADSVDQLLEIVKAVQRGEDPDEMLRKKQAESAPLADSPKSNPEINEQEKEPVRRWSFRTSGQKKTEKADRNTPDPENADEENQYSVDAKEWMDDDDFEKLLNDDAQNSLDVSAFAEKLSAVRQKLSGILAKSKTASEAKRREKKADDDFSHEKTEDEKAIDRILDLHEAPDDDRSDEPVSSDTAVSEPITESEYETVSGSKTGAGDKKASEEQAATGDKKVSEEQAATGDKKASEEQAATGDKKVSEERAVSGDKKVSEEQSSSGDKMISEDEAASDNEAISGSDSVPEESSKAAKHRMGKLRASAERDRSAGIPGLPNGIARYFDRLMENLSQKGIHSKELLMIAAGVVLAVMIILMLVNSLRASLEDKKKSEHVTADAGFTVTVEKEPEQWCSSYMVSLRFRVKGGTVTSVNIDGTAYEPDENGVVEVNARDYLIQASVETEEGTKNARIEIPMIDAQMPVVNAAREKDTIVLTAADGRSGVKKIWYAKVHDWDYIDLPLYTEYDGPLTYEADTMYYFYAEDLAGNKSHPVATTMEQSREIVLGNSEMSLFPDETVYLQVDGNPSGSLLNGLTFESMNPSVVTVSNTGLVTAVGEGSTVIRVSADGLEDVTCPVEVSRERSVTISAVGDCTLGTDESFNTNTNFQAFDSVNGHSYFFANVSDILENDDATFANLECVFTTETTREVKQYAFRGSPDYTEILQDGSVEVVTLANNHSSDYGAQSLDDTKQYLEEAGIDYCTGDTIAFRNLKGIRTAFIGIYVLNDGMGREEQVRETIAAAKSRGAQLVIVGFHWGSEKATQPDDTQVALAHTAVDCGADLVVGHHPHVLQGIEKYNGKYIVYSLGNFCFGGNSTPSDMDTVIFRQTFTICDGEVQDDDQIEIVPCSISSTAGYNNYQPTPATGSEAERIIGRVNEYSASYGQTYTASTGLD